MKQIVDAVRDLLTSTALTGDEAGEAATYTLENVNWSSKLELQEPRNLPVTDECLEGLCTNAGQYGSNAHMIGGAILKAGDQIRWNRPEFDEDGEADIAAFQNRYAWCSIIGCAAPLRSDKVEMGFTIQAQDVYYPPHVHQAVETYWIIGGDGDWKVGAEPWFGVEAGSIIHHETGARHAMQTNRSALLSMFLWTTHLNSRVVIVRG